jgi:23S rRNA (cytidine1920-2'-O)/16S rRNA (cytidine1409-2'-O)-methyltransferase
MPGARRAPIILLTRLLAERRPELTDPIAAIVEGRVVVDGRTIDNPRARVPRSASLRVLPVRRLRGEAKLGAALDAFAIDAEGATAVDVGAAAGGFTSALISHGAALVYAVDVGFGQLAGRLRADPRVIDLERTNIADLDARLIPDRIDVVTMDLSYLSVAAAVVALDRLRLADGARLIALVKPTFELRSATLVTDPADVRRAIAHATAAIESAGWQPLACTLPRQSGAHGAIEAFVFADRAPDHTDRARR